MTEPRGRMTPDEFAAWTDAHPPLGTSVVTFSDGTTGRILDENTRIRHRQFPELTGYIKHWEWNRPPGDPEHPAGLVSPIPYCIGWDDSEAAVRKLGWLFVYAGQDSVVSVEPGVVAP